MPFPAPRDPRPDSSLRRATLSLPIDASGSAGGGARRAAARGTFHARTWLWVLVALVLLFQLSLLGLRPALAESARLARGEQRLLAAYQGEREQALRLERMLRAHSDPVYLERERRMLAVESSPLLAR